MEHNDNPAAVCLSCGDNFTGRYCGSCGEKRVSEHEQTVSHFLMHAFHELTHADGKFLQSLKYLFFRPGALSVNYLSGRRRLFMAPLSMFLFANLLYLLFSPIDALNSKFYSQQGQVYGELARKMQERKMEQRGWSEIRMAERYDAKSGKLAKLLLFLLVLFLSVPLALVYHRRKKNYFVHLILATEIVNFIILVILIALPWLLELLFRITNILFDVQPHVDANATITIFFLAMGLAGYLTLATKNLYQSGWRTAALKSIVLIFGLVCSILLYRFTLLTATLAML